MFQDIMGLLRRLGLKDNEAQVYLTCLHARQGLYVHQIVSQTKQKRSSIDVILKRLVQDGYVDRVKTGNRYQYLPTRAETLLFRHEQLTEDLRNAVPILSRLSHSDEQTDVRFFEGREGVRKIYDDVLLRLKFAEGERKSLLSFSNGANMMRVFPDMQKRFIDKRIQMGVWYKSIVPQSSIKQSEYATDENQLRLIKAIDDQKFPFHVSIETYADSLMIYSPEKPYGGVVIRNMRIADSMRSLFNLVWSLLG